MRNPRALVPSCLNTLNLIAGLMLMAVVGLMACGERSVHPLPKAPVLASVTPSQVEVGSQVSVTLEGEHFLQGQFALQVSGEGVVAGEPVIESAHVVTVELTVAVDAEPGPRELTAQTIGGETQPVVISVVYAEVGIGAFFAEPGIVRAGEEMELAWRGVTGADVCEIVPSIGEVPCEDGSVVVRPDVEMDYTLIATGPLGVVSARTTVRIVPSGSVIFDAVGDAEFVVPSGVTTLSVEAYGAAGGDGGTGAPGGGGAFVRVPALVVHPGERLTLKLGGRGGAGRFGGSEDCGFGLGGFNGGGAAGKCFHSGGGGGGGGATSILRDETPLLVAAGGGGGTGQGSFGGGAGGEKGQDGAAAAGDWAAGGGGGASQTAGGAGGPGNGLGLPGTDGTAGQGGDGGLSSGNSGGGGGGGLFGGGGGGGSQSGHSGGGGGGSSMGPPDASFTTGAGTGDGQITISW